MLLLSKASTATKSLEQALDSSGLQILGRQLLYYSLEMHDLWSFQNKNQTHPQLVKGSNFQVLTRILLIRTTEFTKQPRNSCEKILFKFYENT